MYIYLYILYSITIIINSINILIVSLTLACAARCHPITTVHCAVKSSYLFLCYIIIFYTVITGQHCITVICQYVLTCMNKF